MRRQRRAIAPCRQTQIAEAAEERWLRRESVIPYVSETSKQTPKGSLKKICNDNETKTVDSTGNLLRRHQNSQNSETGRVYLPMLASEIVRLIPVLVSSRGPQAPVISFIWVNCRLCQ